MSVSGVMNTALTGLQAQSERVSVVAVNVANASTPGYARVNASLQATETGGVKAVVSSTSSDTDLATEMTDLVEAEQSYKANAAVFETGADLWDVLMSIKRD